MSLTQYSCPLCRHGFAMEASLAPAPLPCPACQQLLALPSAAPRWFYIKEGGKQGPIPLAQLHDLLRRGELARDAMLLREGTSKWLAAASVPGLVLEKVRWGELGAQARQATQRSWQHAQLRPRTALAGAAGVLLVLVALGYASFGGRSVDDDPQPRAEPKRSPQPIAKAAPLPTAPEEPAEEETLADAMAYLNEQRRRSGVAPVALADELAEDCQAHADYLARNESKDAHAQEVGKPGASVGGATAACVGFVAFCKPREAIAQLLRRPAGSAALLHPALRSIGLGHASAAPDRDVLVLDAERGRLRQSPGRVVLFPAPEQTEVPLQAASRAEAPGDGGATMPGFPITIQFPGAVQVARAQAKLRTSAGSEVDAWLTPPRPPGKLLALIPKQPLRAGESYRVLAAAEVDGKIWEQSWTFSTRKSDVTAARYPVAIDDSEEIDWTKQVLQTVNRWRERAGLLPVQLDLVLTRGCYAHAFYLAANADEPSVHGAGAREERSELPSFSTEGQRAAGYSESLFNAPTPLHQVEQMLGSIQGRQALLEPLLQRLGFGCKEDGRRGWVCVLNITSGRAPSALAAIALAPGNGQIGVPCGGVTDTGAGTIGYPIVVLLPDDLRATEVAATVTDDSGRKVALATAIGAGALLVQSQEPFQPMTSYHVQLRATLNGQPWQQQWRFRTAMAGSALPSARISIPGK